jgi:L,D-peptidoglycan transpeptidase YkuD (ErfK/YbiS/YcfS/YnhG family)
MKIVVVPEGFAEWNDHRVPCALGRAGVSRHKQEGDGATPVGCFALRHVLYRGDRVAKPVTSLRVSPIGPLDAWCDDPDDPLYNRPVCQPYDASYEPLWRDDRIYDIVVVLGFNDDPVIPGQGSAIFLHIARPDFEPTKGCIAVSEPNLRQILRASEPNSVLCVKSR